MNAMATLIHERGFGRVTAEAVAQRAGTNKNAIYRRYNSLPHLAVAALSSRFGLDFDVHTDTLTGDLDFMVKRLAQFFTDPLIAGSCADLLGAIRSNEDLAEIFAAEFLQPRLETVRAVLARASERGEITTTPDPDWIVSLMIGPFLYRTLVPGAPRIDTTLIERVTSVLLDALDATAPVNAEAEGEK